MPGRCTARRWSVWWRATTPSRRDARVRLAKRTSNLFRARDRPRTAGPRRQRPRRRHRGRPRGPDRRRRRACAPTSTSSRRPSPHGLTPLVVPQLKTITLGGAVTGPRHRVGLVPQRPAPRVRRSRSTSSPGRARWSRPHPDGRATPTSSAVSPTPTAPWATRRGCGSSSSRWSRSSSCATCASTTSTTLVAVLERIVARRVPSTASAVDYVDGVVFSRHRVLPRRSGRQSDEPGPTATTRARRSTTAPSSTTATPRARPAHHRSTTCGAGTPTGSGARRAFGAQNPRCAGCGPGAGCAAASTGS